MWVSCVEDLLSIQPTNLCHATLPKCLFYCIRLVTCSSPLFWIYLVVTSLFCQFRVILWVCFAVFFSNLKSLFTGCFSDNGSFSFFFLYPSGCSNFYVSLDSSIYVPGLMHLRHDPSICVTWHDSVVSGCCPMPSRHSTSWGFSIHFQEEQSHSNRITRVWFAKSYRTPK